MKNPYDRKRVLEDGTEYYGYAFGDGEDKVTEIASAFCAF